MVTILNELKSTYDWQELKTIFPKAGEGTLRAINQEREEFIYGKEILVESMENRIDITKRQNTGKRGAV
jgi:hypothetical protein